MPEVRSVEATVASQQAIGYVLGMGTDQEVADDSSPSASTRAIGAPGAPR